MKRLLLCSFIVLATAFISYSQQVKKIRKVVTVLPQQSSYLNGGMRATFGGKSRIIFEVKLPSNTVEWYYTFTTTANENESKSLNLLPQLTRLFDPTGTSAIVASALMSPTGSNSCDVYLMNRANADAFINKVDLNGGKYYHVLEAARENFRNGVVQVSNLRSGVWYLGFKNPSTSVGIGIIVEVAAIVEETEVDNSTWSSETKQRFFQEYFSGYKRQNMDDGTAKDMAECLVAKITESKTPEQYDAMPQFEKENFVKKCHEDCSAKYKVARTPDQEKAVSYGTLGWKAYEAGDVDKCIEFSKKALSLDGSLGWVKSNLGLCYLIKADESTATDYYIEALSDIKKNSNPVAKTYLKATIDDINNAASKLANVKGVEYIKSMFESELKNY